MEDDQTIVEEIISDIEGEITDSLPGSNYYTIEGSTIPVDPAIIRDWFEQYQDIMRSRYLGE